MGARRKAREAALQALFSIDAAGEHPSALSDDLFEMLNPPEPSREYFKSLVNGVLSRKEMIDRKIENTSSNWRISRMNTVDRNILRIAVYEILFGDGIPPKGAINEAVELAKKFGTERSGAFVNGILDRIFHTTDKGPANTEADGNNEEETDGPVHDNGPLTPSPVP